MVGTHGHGHGAPKVDSIIATCRCSRAFLGASVVRRRLIRHCKLHRVLVLHQSIAAEQAAALSEFFLMGRRGTLPRKLHMLMNIEYICFNGGALGSKALTLHCNGKKILGILAGLPMMHANSNDFVVSVKPT